VISAPFSFRGTPAHASTSPHQGKSALDAVELMNLGTNYLREHLKEDLRIHYVITDGGGQPNVVPAVAGSWYYVRANRHEDAEAAFARLLDVARGAALMSGVAASWVVEGDSHEVLPNRALAQMIQRHLERVGQSWQVAARTGTSIGEKAMEVAAKVLSGAGLELLTDPKALAAVRTSFREIRDPLTFTSLLPKDARPPVAIRKK
jgi:aminobenzoyl-glutamate utilization protein B